MPLIVTLLMLLAGCAGDVNILPTITPDTLVEPNQGIVVARVINTGPFPLPFNQLTINPQNLNESAEVKPERLVSLQKQIDGSTIFASPVNSGAYSLSSIRAFHVLGETYYSRFVSADVKFGTFEVRPGQVTDLGTIIYYPKPAVDKYQDTLVRLPGDEPGETLDVHFPFKSYDKNNLLSWNEDGFADERHALYLSILQNPVTFETTYKAPNGSLFFLAKLGVIIERSADGQWDIDAVDTNLDLTSMAQNESGDRIVGGSEGHIFWKSADGEWRDVSLDSAYHVDALEFGPDGRAIVLARQETHAAIMAADLSRGDSNWQEINRFNSVDGWTKAVAPDREPYKKPDAEPHRIANAALSTFEGRHYLKLSTHPKNRSWVFPNAKTHAFSYDPATWVMAPEKNANKVYETMSAGALEMAIELPGFWSWDGKPIFRRFDPATGQWEEIETHVNVCDGEVVRKTLCGKPSSPTKARRRSFTFRAPPWFKNDREAITVANFSNLNIWSGDRSTETKILSTDDGGKIWVETGHSLPNDYCTRIIPDVSDRLLLSCSGATGDFYESTDDGATWTQVREHQNF